ncbi:MAG: DNA mismatch repair endonuclease MutL [Vicinamibacterales bacterium]
MGKINRLPTELSNQIAAGEVVERPASAVKELVENALDAGAERIAITIEQGGKRLIRVEDDGEGMTAEDAVLALERHATSKVSRLEDLGKIATLGFRGEALPSVASVSHLTLRTRARGSAHGLEIRVDGGVAGRPKQVGMPEGTVIEVADLFFNVPARRKFLKSDGAESSQASRAVTQLALGHPGVGFTLTSGPRRLVQCAPVRNLDDRFLQLYGDRGDLVEVRKTAAGVTVRGYVAALTDHGAARGPQNIFVNGRVVKDRTVAHAIHDAYSRATVKPRTPEVHLFLDLPADRVDVNVHPTKAEVRFLEQSLVHELLRRALGDALGQPTSAPLSPTAGTGGRAAPRAIPGIVGGMAAASRWAGFTDVFARDAGERSTAAVTFGRGSTEAPSVREAEPSTFAGSADTPPMMPLGQFRDTFIIAVDADGVAIIDQHVAHERILYERVMERLTDGVLEGQGLLAPMVIDLPPGQREALASHAEHLTRLGFEVGSFGGDSVSVTTIPSVLALAEAEAAVRALAADLEGLDSGAAVEDVLKRLAATTACHAAVKANDRLTQEKMVYLLEELRRTEYSTVCPHGRPVVLRLSRQEIEKRFERT